MNTLFGSGLFTGNIRPQRAQFGEAIYWVPVLLAYTGARSEEVCQLFRRDVEQKNGQWVIHIRDWDESQSVKTGKEREVPLHPHLLELGFERFLEAQQARCSPSWSQASLVGATASIWASGSGSRSVRSWNSRRAPSPRYTPSGIPSLPTCGSWVSGKICKTPSPATRKAPTWADVTARSDSYMRPSARCPMAGACMAAPWCH